MWHAGKEFLQKRRFDARQKRSRTRRISRRCMFRSRVIVANNSKDLFPPSYPRHSLGILHGVGADLVPYSIRNGPRKIEHPGDAIRKMSPQRAVRNSVTAESLKQSSDTWPVNWRGTTTAIERKIKAALKPSGFPKRRTWDANRSY